MRQKIIDFISQTLQEYKDSDDDYYLDKISDGADTESVWRLYTVNFDASRPYRGVVITVGDGVEIAAQKKEKLDDFTNRDAGGEDGTTLFNKFAFLLKNDRSDDAKEKLTELIDNKLDIASFEGKDKVASDSKNSNNGDENIAQKTSTSTSPSKRTKSQKQGNRSDESESEGQGQEKGRGNKNDQDASSNTANHTRDDSGDGVECAIYIIKTDDGMVNIGVSKTPEHKKDELQAASPKGLELHKTWWVATKKKAKQIQDRVYKLLEGSKTESGNGWFNTTAEYAQQVINAMLETSGQEANTATHAGNSDNKEPDDDARQTKSDRGSIAGMLMLLFGGLATLVSITSLSQQDNMVVPIIIIILCSLPGVLYMYLGYCLQNKKQDTNQVAIAFLVGMVAATPFLIFAYNMHINIIDNKIERIEERYERKKALGTDTIVDAINSLGTLDLASRKYSLYRVYFLLFALMVFIYSTGAGLARYYYKYYTSI